MPKPKSNDTSVSALAAKSINPDEIDWFNKQAHEWWDPNGVEHMLHDYNHLRIPWIRDGALILDAGCGGGILTEAIGRSKGTVVGLDCAKQLIDLTENHLAPQDDIKPYITYVCETIEEHSAFLECCVKALKPGGSIFITTISKTFMGWFIAKLWAEYITGIIRRGSHEFRLFITPKEVSKILKEFNCKTEKVKGVRYDFFRRRENKFQHTFYHGVAYTLQAVKEK
ncbi:hypothetical protein PVAND_012375 [Polypedilum vanderplanki]|uniref:Hexaprenyldihydroxybenzoate methyltransferase n=1 Tax=Polypedilum vanderplanki TaxID=319348 RepID=A0A9J6CN81_POLVA|nr:hypothetical protein PVAND_012375 [Polypedilum vanderplanki]